MGTGPFNLGVADDHRVPDHGYHRVLPTDLWVPTAAVVVEVVSPDDETFEKFGFYTQHHVDELIIANPTARSIRTFRRTGDSFLETSCSDLLQISTEALATGVNWP